jgi:hypothetical protein
MFRYLAGKLCPGFLAVFISARILVPQETGQNDNVGITVQLPTLGVSIDAAGVLATRVFPDPGGRLMRARLSAAAKQLKPELHRPSACRKISLRRLEDAIVEHLDGDPSVPAELQFLAGLMRVEYVFLLPEENDILIAGPAEPWVQNPAGRTIGIVSGQPTLLLEDLVMALRTFGPDRKLNTWVGCTINPTAQGLKNLKSFQQRLPSQIHPRDRPAAAESLAEEMRDSLGLADVAVYGIHPRSHAAHVLIEADYRMKLIAIGLEAPPVRMTTFVAALKGAPRNLQRWWLTPEYRCLRASQDGRVIQLASRDVRLETENIRFGPHARITRTAVRPGRAARAYATSFTKNFQRIAEVRPVFSQLRNVIDLLIAAAWIRQENGYAKSGWLPRLFVDESKFAVHVHGEIAKAQCVANAVWKQNILVLPAGGGVSIMAAEALKSGQRLPDEGRTLQDFADSINLPDDSRWWWD